MTIYRNFVGLSGSQKIPDRASILRLRRLLENHNLSPRILRIINDKLSSLGMLLKTDTVVDPMLIAAPSSTKNKDGECDPEMHQVKKGNQWHFGMKADIGVNTESGLVPTVVGTAANVNDVTQGHAWLHGGGTVVFADSGYQGATKRPASTGVDWRIAMRPGKRKQQKHTPWDALPEQLEKINPSVSAKVEYRFCVIKQQFSNTKVGRRELAKNTAQLVTLFSLSNIWMARKVLMQMA